VWHNKLESDRAIADFDEAIRLDPKDASAYNGRAWLEATCPEARFRNGKMAVDDASTCCELDGWTEPDYLDTLAAAYAEAGDFDTAVRWAEQALDTVSNDKKREFQSRLELYKEHKPYRKESFNHPTSGRGTVEHWAVHAGWE
jgi:tetratricopeptide (TPR) repeat protein